MSSSNFDIDKFIDRIRALGKRARFEVQPIGMVEEVPLLVLTRKAQTPDGEILAHPTAKLYLSAGVHGDEPAGPLALLRLLQQRWFSPDIEWTLFPLLNPSGIALGRRENSRGEDLNRDYFQGTSTEVNAHRHWLENHCEPQHYDLSLLLHEDWESSGFYIYELSLIAGRTIAGPLLQAAQQWMPLDLSETIDGHFAKQGRIAPLEFEEFSLEDESNLPGAEAVYLSKYLSQLNYTLETPSSLPIATRIDTQVGAIQAGIEHFLKLPGRGTSRENS